MDGPADSKPLRVRSRSRERRDRGMAHLLVHLRSLRPVRTRAVHIRVQGTKGHEAPQRKSITPRTPPHPPPSIPHLQTGMLPLMQVGNV